MSMINPSWGSKSRFPRSYGSVHGIWWDSVSVPSQRRGVSHDPFKVLKFHAPYRVSLGTDDQGLLACP